MSPHYARGVRHGLLCCGLGAIAACTAPAPRPSKAPTTIVVAPAVVEPVREPPQAAVVEAPRDRSPWARLRDRFEMKGCDYRTDVQRHAQAYARGSRAFTASWKKAMPFLLMVVDELERRDLPGEFAMLPFVESGYRPVAGRGERPAGMWQLMPDTARGAGLSITKRYDGRLDAVASTRAALDLIERYEREFGDWRLVNMAFNSGEFRVKKLLNGRDPASLSAEELARIAFNPITHEHLDRVLALSCIVSDPQRFGITLPEPREADRLQVVELQSPIDLRLAARFAGVNVDDLRRWNAGHLGNRMASGDKPRLLMPTVAVERFHAAASELPLAYWSDWREQSAPHGGGIAMWAAEIGVPVAVLALANSLDEGASVGRNTRILIPGREPEPVADETRKGKPRVHIVVAGDTLSGIARRHHVALKDLRRWNPRATGTLRLGDRLRLGPTEG